MAEGGYDPGETTNPFDPHEGDEGTSDKTPLFPEGMGMKHRFPDPSWKHQPGYEPPVTKTSTSQQHDSSLHETSFIDDTTSERIYNSKAEQEIHERLKEKEELDRIVLKVFPEIKKYRLSQVSYNEYGQIVINEGKKNSIPHIIIVGEEASYSVLRSNFPKGIRKDLGRTNVQINQENYEKQQKEEERQAERVKKHEEAIKAEADNDEELQDSRDRLSNLQGVLREQLEAKKKAAPEEVEDIDRNITRTRKSIKTVGIEVDGFAKAER